MKKQNKLSIKVRDLEPLKDVVGGRRHRRHGLHAKGSEGEGFQSPLRRIQGWLGPLRTQIDSITDRERTAWFYPTPRLLIVCSCRKTTADRTAMHGDQIYAAFIFARTDFVKVRSFEDS